MDPTVNRQFILKSRPVALPTPEEVPMIESPVPEAGEVDGVLDSTRREKTWGADRQRDANRFLVERMSVTCRTVLQELFAVHAHDNDDRVIEGAGECATRSQSRCGRPRKWSGTNPAPGCRSVFQAFRHRLRCRVGELLAIMVR